MRRLAGPWSLGLEKALSTLPSWVRAEGSVVLATRSFAAIRRTVVITLSFASKSTAFVKVFAFEYLDRAAFQFASTSFNFAPATMRPVAIAASLSWFLFGIWSSPTTILHATPPTQMNYIVQSCVVDSD